MQYLYTAGFPTEDFAWVVFMIVIAALQHQHFGNNVGLARKRIGVAYPTMYVEAGKAYGRTPDGNPNPMLTDAAADEFNRVQRVHGNNCENIATFYALALVAGLSFPVPAAVFCGAWILGRGLFAYGYYRGVQQRMWGAIHYAGTLGLLSLCIAFGVQLLRKAEPYK